MKKLNFSNATHLLLNDQNNSMLMTKIRKLFLVSCFILNGCSSHYNHQPSAPVYTNPGATDSPVDRTIPQEKIDESTKHKKLPSFWPEIKKRTTPPVARKRLSPAVLALVASADNSSKAGDLEAAVSTIERALRIDSRNPVLTYKLAMLRLHQSKPRLAEDLAKKAALLSANDRQLKKQSWLLISKARKLQKNDYGAKEALLKANSY